MLDEILELARREHHDVKLINAQTTMMLGETEIWFVIYSHGYSTGDLSHIKAHRWAVYEVQDGEVRTKGGGILDYMDGVSEV